MLVDPVLHIGEDLLPLGAITMQTMLAPSMGPVKQWTERLRVASETNYNMIHFTPIQVQPLDHQCLTCICSGGENRCLPTRSNPTLNWTRVSHAVSKFLKAELAHVFCRF